MTKQKEYKWGELNVNATEAPIFDTKSQKFTHSLISVKYEAIDFERLVNEIIKNIPNAQVPFIITFTEKW